jgi:hypothetical protein
MVENFVLIEDYVKSLRNSLLCLGLFCLAGMAQDNNKTPPADRPLPPGSTTLHNIEAPPPLARIPDVRQPGETGWWFEVDAWLPTQQPIINAGHGASGFTYPSYVQMQGTPTFADGAEAGVALGQHNALRFSYWTTRASGDIPSIPNGLELWSQTYAPGTYLSTNYQLMNAKISFDYLSWPYPAGARHFRLKTLWQVQFTSIRTGFDAPELPLVNSAGSPILDASGNPISYAGIGTRWFISPEFGLGASYYKGRHLRLDANAAGFAFPHHDTVWDGDASANLRFGHVEFRAGVKAFHFKTSPESTFFVHGTDAAAFIGVRWHSQ